MSTRGDICVKVQEKDFNRISNILDREISADLPYIYIYNHFDSYVKGLGEKLKRDYNDYESALKLVLEGDCSYPGSPYSLYETYGYNKPKAVSTKEEALKEEYLYVFENGIWNGYDDNMNKVM